MTEMADADRAQGSVGVRSRQLRPPECAVASDTSPNILVNAVMVMVELKHIEKIPDGRTIERHVGIVVVGNRVREIVPAAMSQRFQIPISLDELQDRDVIGVGVADMTALRKARHDDERNPRTVAEEVERLDVSGDIEAASLIESDEQCGLVHQFGIGLEMINNVLDHSLKQVNLGRRWVTVEQGVRLDVRNG